ncbi:MAG: SpoIID/LytB domain-containing protein [Gemmatimonadales bacterium]
MARPLLALGLAVLACSQPELPPVTTAVPAVSAEPEIRVGLAVNVARTVIGGGGELRLESLDGSVLGVVPPGGTATILRGAQGLLVRQGVERIASVQALSVLPADSALVRFNGRDYRGWLTLSSGAAGIVAANVVGLETYLAGVVAAEMGRRNAEDAAALKAQAVLSRTVAMRALGRWRLRGYDLVATVADQAYAGVGFEYPLATLAVAETRGEVLTWDGRLIDGFFHSTCAGRTADGSEIFVNATAPYLRSIRDEDAQGRAWCSISPRWRWREEWSRESLIRMLRETIAATGGSAAIADDPIDIRVLETSPTGRVTRLEVAGAAGRHEVTRHGVRQLLRPADAAILRSPTFTLQTTREGDRLIRLVAEGAGAGHGVGMCQWGALGRSRAGFSYRDILAAYFPGTEIGRTF